MPILKGDFISLNYTAKVKETNEIFDTTFEEIAKKEQLYKEGELYGPKLIVVGEGWVLKPLDETLLTMKLRKAQTVEIPPEKAFGPRDPDKVKRVPLKHLTSKGKTPVIGMRIDYNGKMATVRAIGAGRVLLDFNPPLAGKTLIYEAVVDKKIKTKKAKIQSLIHRRIPLADQTKFVIALKQKVLTINMPEDTFYIEGIQISKRGIAMDIQRLIEGDLQIDFVETFKSSPKESKTKKKSKT
ncbi:MAG: peptidylprolyl isomerase [Candidatus Bathyarchaeota archaeon]|nr:peptidylprolyl isomerase [Candidatus Bathyarchaeota archaeon]